MSDKICLDSVFERTKEISSKVNGLMTELDGEGVNSITMHAVIASVLCYVAVADDIPFSNKADFFMITRNIVDVVFMEIMKEGDE